MKEKSTLNVRARDLCKSDVIVGFACVVVGIEKVSHFDEVIAHILIII
jgi:hypothetical protein